MLWENSPVRVSGRIRDASASRRTPLWTLAAHHQPTHDVRPRSHHMRYHLTAPTPPAAPRGSAYAQLSRQVKQAGLLERRPRRYIWRIAITATLLAAGWAAFVLVGNSWWQLAVAAFLAVMLHVLAFTPAQARGSRGLSRMMFRNQAYLFFPLLLGEAFSVHVASIRALLRRDSRVRPAEAALLATHLAGYLAVVFLVLSPV